MSILQAYKLILSNICNQKTTTDNKIYLWACRVYLITRGFSLSSGAFRMTILNGTDFQTSIKQAYDIIVQKPKRFLTVKVVSI